MLELELEKKLGNFQLSLSLNVDRKQILALCGASGSGKTMTLKCISGIENPDSGFISLDGRMLFDSRSRTKLAVRKRHVGYLFQSYALFPNMTVEENIMCGLIGRGAEEQSFLVDRYMEKMELNDCRGKKPFQLSGGQQQRTALARILINEPGVLLLDEPFSALDPYLRFNLIARTKELLSEFDGPVILVSHSPEEMRLLSTQIAVIKDGKLVQHGETAAVFSSPADEYVSSILNPWRNGEDLKI